MLPNDQTAEVIRLSLLRSKMTGGGKDAAEARRVIEYYRDALYQAEDLKTQLTPLFANQAKWLARPKAVYNLTAGIVDAISTLYADPVTYDFGGDARAEELWDRVFGWHALMADVDRYTLLGGTTAVRPVVNAAGDVDFRIYLADQIEYVQSPEDALIAQQITLRWRTGQGVLQQSVAQHWSAEECAETVDETLTGEIEPNPYKEIPIEIFRNSEPRWDWFDKPASDLCAANLALNAMMTDLNHTVRWQAHGQLVLIGAPPNYQPPIGADTFLSVSNAPGATGADARYINPGADIGAIINAINQNLDLLFAARRIPKSAVVAVQGDSGVSLVAQQASLRDYRKKRLAVFRPLEEGLICKTLRVIHYHETGDVVDFDPPVIRYTELDAPMDDSVRLDWDWRLHHGFASPVDVMQALNPGMSDPDALEKIAENRKAAVVDYSNRLTSRRRKYDTTRDGGAGQ